MDQTTLKAMIDDLEYRKSELKDQLKKNEDAISALQAVCEHGFVSAGHDSHYSYEKCKYCGLRQKK